MLDLVYFYPEGHTAHSLPGHPERPERIEAITSGLKGLGMWDPYPRIAPIDLPDEVLYAIHTRQHVQSIERTSRLGGMVDPDTFLSRSSYELATKAAGGAAAVALAVWSGEARTGFALSRPPGHHATSNRAMGFCLLNNIALAAETLIKNGGAKRLAIVDLDLHHGNGTQDIFFERADVFYFSTHEWPLFPGTGGLYETGKGSGARHTANLPLPAYSGDQAFQAAVDEWILPLLTRYQPEMILVSFGADPHWRDPLGNLILTAGKYGQLIGALRQFADEHCGGRIALVLEGGYDLGGASACACAAVSALLGLPYTDPIGAGPHGERNQWKDVLYKAKLLWEV